MKSHHRHALLALSVALAAALLLPGCPSSLGARHGGAAPDTDGDDDDDDGDADGPGGDADTDDDGDADGPGDADADADADTDADADADTDADADDGPPPECAGVDCGANGRCAAVAEGVACLCHDGFHLERGACTPNGADGACANVECGAHGTCRIEPLGWAVCACERGYAPYGLACVDERLLGCRDADGSFVPRGTSRCDATDTHLEVCHDGDGDTLSEWIFGADCVSTPCSTSCLGVPCDVQPCPVGTVCVPEAHEMPLNVCVVTCDCSNCGNCDMQDFVDAGGVWQLQCGAPEGPAPTDACRLPCPNAGDGCIPYEPALCWPMEGCLSAGAPAP